MSILGSSPQQPAIEDAENTAEDANNNAGDVEGNRDLLDIVSTTTEVEEDGEEDPVSTCSSTSLESVARHGE